MPYQNDMSTLADVVSPAYASMQGGLQQQMSDQEQGMKNAVAMQQAPAEAAKPGLQNLLTQAQTVGAQGLGMSEQAKGLKDLYAAPSGAQAEVSGNQLKVSQDQLQKLSQLGGMANAIAAQMDNIPAPARPAAMQALTQQYGINPSDLGPMMSGDPDLLRHVATNMIQGSQQYQTEMNVQGLKNVGAQGVAETQGSARVQAAETTAAARVQVANTVKQMHEQQQTFEQAAVRLQSTNPQLAQQYAQAALQLKQAQAGITSQMVTGAPLQMPDISVLGGQGGGGGQAPATPQQPAGGNAIEAEMRRRGFLK